METTTAGTRRTRPPAPRSAPDLEQLRDTRPPVLRRPPVPGTPPGPAGQLPRPPAPREDPAQAFVTALRAAAPRFAAAAGVATAVVAEAVPPARHRRARCRVALLTADGDACAVVFTGVPGRPAAAAATTFTDAIAAWLAREVLPLGGGAGGGERVVDLSGGLAPH